MWESHSFGGFEMYFGSIVYDHVTEMSDPPTTRLGEGLVYHAFIFSLWELTTSLSGLCAQAKPRLQRGGSSASLHNSLMRNSIFQLMIHTLDPLAEGKHQALVLGACLGEKRV